METLTAFFNGAASMAGWLAYPAGLAVTAGLVYFGYPRQLKPENNIAKVVTARQWPNILKSDKIVAINGPKIYSKMGASEPSNIPLSAFRVPITRKGKDDALRLKDNIKAEVDVEFSVRVDTKSPDGIVKALEALGGEIDQTIITAHCTAKFDAALRAAAKMMDVDQIQTERLAFRQAVIEALDALKGEGLELTDVSLRRLEQSPLNDFDPENYYDAEGLKKLTERIEESKKHVNDTTQAAATKIAERNKLEAIQRLTIEEEQKKATLEQQERVAQAEAEQAQRVEATRAANKKAGDIARIAAEQETEARGITKQQEIGVAQAQRDQALAVAQQEQVRRSREAELNTRVALHQKALEEAAAEEAAHAARAEAVAAEESVNTARLTAQAERQRQIEVIAARAEAERAAAGERTAAETRVFVAEQDKTAAQAQADAALIEAKAAKDAAIMAAEGAAAEIFQKLKAEADGKLERAKADEAINQAINKLNPEAMAHLVEMARVSMTPEAIREAMKAAEKISAINITSMDGVAGVFGGAAGAPAVSGDATAVVNNPIAQMVQAYMTVRMSEPLMDKVIAGVGGDQAIARNVPGNFNAAAALASFDGGVAIPPAVAEQDKGPAKPAAPVASPAPGR